jgi:hypothetical protein
MILALARAGSFRQMQNIVISAMQHVAWPGRIIPYTIGVDSTRHVGRGEYHGYAGCK